jgi:hypothetical protein
MGSELLMLLSRRTTSSGLGELHMQGYFAYLEKSLVP